MEFIQNFINHLLVEFHKNLFPAIFYTVLAIFTKEYFAEHGVKNSIDHIWEKMKKENRTRRQLAFFLYFFLVLGMALFTRVQITSPYNKVMEGWTVIQKADGSWDYDPINNLIMFIPLTFLLFFAFPKLARDNRFSTILKQSIKFSFCASLFIECWQLFLALGTFQIADITYNTISGIVGGILFYLVKGRKTKK